MSDALLLIVMVVGWVAVQYWLLPRLGVPT